MPILYFETAYSMDEQGCGPGAAKYFDFSSPSLHPKHGAHFQICLMSSTPLNLQ
jgi:hypothetical protein